ncbi:MAG: hypothetical protein ACK53L_28310, partial [Pirellulaceae bacterium]
ALSTATPSGKELITSSAAMPATLILATPNPPLVRAVSRRAVTFLSRLLNIGDKVGDSTDRIDLPK